MVNSLEDKEIIIELKAKIVLLEKKLELVLNSLENAGVLRKEIIEEELKEQL